MPTAQHMWDQLLVSTPHIRTYLDKENSHSAFTRVSKAAQEHGRTVYDGLVQEQDRRMVQEREKAEYAFSARRKAIMRAGLPQVRDHRLSQLEQEKQKFYKDSEESSHMYPEIVPLILVCIEGG